jgi:hypothetical protein
MPAEFASVLERLYEHLRASVGAHDLEAFVEKPHRMEARPGRRVEDLHRAAFFEAFDEEIAFALAPRFPVNEFVPLLDETLDVLDLIVIRLPNPRGIAPERLLAIRRHETPPYP